jgi:hypothetical protein
MILLSTLVLTAARRTLGWRWAATVVALIYLACRVATNLLLGAFDFPTAFIPVMLLGGALIVDLAERRRWHPFTTAAALVAAYYPSAALIGYYTLMPEFAITTAPFVFTALYAGLAAARWWQQRRHDVAVQVA